MFTQQLCFCCFLNVGNIIVLAFLILTFHYGNLKRKNKYEVYHIRQWRKSIFSKQWKKSILTINALREINAMGLCERNYFI